ncbi:shikimate kinase [Flavobacteriaceae bacterium AU392]|nr:shikimate kinase [Flavobacteriaceae bacterium]RKM86830.1 shikimate kinase [Flavobacteriaceae bacterium AU392]
MIIILLGYMASGKSTIGRELAEKLKYNFIDLDDFIEQSEGKTISSIFKDKGEIYFRKKEALSLNQILVDNTKLILALGGGTPCYAGNMDKITNNKAITSIYLKSSINSIVERLENETNKRPLISHLTSRELLIEFIGKHLFERTQFYNQSDITITTDLKTTRTIVDDIILNLF